MAVGIARYNPFAHLDDLLQLRLARRDGKAAALGS